MLNFFSNSPSLGTALTSNLGPTLFTSDAQATSNDKSFNVLFATLAAEDLTTSHYRPAKE